MRTTLKDAQISVRFNSEILEAMKKEASAENISLSDFLTRLFQEREKSNLIESRLEALERVVYQSSTAA